MLNSLLNYTYFFLSLFACQSFKKKKSSNPMEFLVGGLNSARKIAWVSWDKVSKSKYDEGLRVKDLWVVNLPLLHK
jgi:hypothetical protein